ncbi:alpha/beta-hydrolase [Bimuria novae-zelandiae CBS 107.79]|uniref:Alpha/beta-hydrolase n=1 Tax=Bimuria novae-zelandiae CBS 107.79 TaxID=1447943 RepID=A0A6A5VIZ7_9PLEO|nr:alpha/beta-hydrolase [Bimuria novae-zelandiae CBS 107.79]
MSLHTTPANRFDSFNLYRTFYKKIGDHEIEANVLVPKGIEPGKCPVMIKWHGGGLTAGTAVHAPYFAAYLVPFLHRNNAIAILPNYRLTPEHSGADILEDIADFQKWFTGSLPAYLASKEPSLGIEIDFPKVLVSGESAGAWLALQSILSLPQGTFAACMLQYPVLSPIPTAPDDIICGGRIPPKEDLDAFLATIKPGTVISDAPPPAREAVAPMLRAHGRWAEFFGEGPHLWPATRIEGAGFFVHTHVMHGRDDTNVPVELSRAFMESARKRFPRTRFEIVTPRGDHGFDAEISEEGEAWLGEFLRGVERDWVGGEGARP